MIILPQRRRRIISPVGALAIFIKPFLTLGKIPFNAYSNSNLI